MRESITGFSRGGQNSRPSLFVETAKPTVSLLDKLLCKACGTQSIDVSTVDEDVLEGADFLRFDDTTEEDPLGDFAGEEARFYSCPLCGDNWLALRRDRVDGRADVTFVHQMGIRPVLRRTAHLASSVLLSEAAVDGWDYFYGDDTVSEGAWRTRLDARRRVLRSICTN